MIRSSLIVSLIGVCWSSPLVSLAPEECPVTEENVLKVTLFVSGKEECSASCQRHPTCNFYNFYPTMEGRPTQCFFFQQCGKTVYDAPSTCTINRENLRSVRPFISDKNGCQSLCQEDNRCAYFKLILSGTEVNSLEVGSGDELPLDNQEESGFKFPTAENQSLTIESSDLTIIGKHVDKSDVKNPDLCYLLSSCSMRIIENLMCTLGKNNFLDLKLFTPDLATCRQYCDKTEGCRYYFWYPIDYSPAPLYCYMFSQCAAKDEEPEVALVLGGRHPGHYFIDTDEFNDIVTRNDVCPVVIGPSDEQVKRAGAVSSYIRDQDVVLLCGGRTEQKVHSSCLQYNISADDWREHSNLLYKRDESSLAMIGSKVYLMGGVNERTVEVLDSALENFWFAGPELPSVMTRSCSVSTESSILIVGGHGNETTDVFPTLLELVTSDNDGSVEWINLPDMMQPRQDHACLFVDFETTSGMLVSGGLGADGEVLSSVEFFDMKRKEWMSVNSLNVARTEHVMSLVYGIPTVIGGVNGDQFISSTEQFDKSEKSKSENLRREWKVSSQVLTSPRYEHTVASVPISKIKTCGTETNS